MNQSKRDEIAALAYRIWVEEGRPPGKAQEHWLRAEQEVAGQAAPPLGDPRFGDADSGDAPASPSPKRKTTRSGRSRTPQQGPRTPQQG